MDDTISTLLRGVAKGKISVEDARKALENATLTEEEMFTAYLTASTATGGTRASSRKYSGSIFGRF